MRIWLLITSTCGGILWFVFRAFYLFCRAAIWRLTGITQTIAHSKNGSSHNASVHVQKILFRFKLDEVVQSAGLNNFITVHESFQSPQYLLKKNITLYCISSENAAFIESDPDVDVTSSKHSSFLRIAQFRLAKKLIVVPIDVFHRIASEIGEPASRKLIILTNTSRCGSTLLTQIFEESGRISAVAEPDAMYNLACIRNRLSAAELDRLIDSSVRVICKNTGPETDAVVIKLSQPAIALTTNIAKVFPRAKYLFMYRNGLPVARSICKLFRSVPHLECLMALTQYSWCVDVGKIVIRMFGVPVNGFDELPAKVTPIYVGTNVWAVSINHYLKFRDEGLQIAAVKYEDIMTNPKYAIRRMFEYCELPYDAEKTCSAFERDSQENTCFSRASLRPFSRKDAISPELMLFLDNLCEKLKAPRITDNSAIEGTITHKDMNGFHRNGFTNGVRQPLAKT